LARPRRNLLERAILASQEKNQLLSLKDFRKIVEKVFTTDIASGVNKGHY